MKEPAAGTTLAPPEEATEEQTRDQLAPRWRVICHDDPITTMDFVVEVLRDVFGLSQARAYERMMRVHGSGAADIGSWPEDEARTKVTRATARARAEGFPLSFTLEPAD
jgi:ATP-dependent Clp protease adaptor protein ClpS